MVNFQRLSASQFLFFICCLLFLIKELHAIFFSSKYSICKKSGAAHTENYSKISLLFFGLENRKT